MVNWQPHCNIRSRAQNCEDGGRKDLLMDIGTEEISHLEIIGTLARIHPVPTKRERAAAEANPLISIVGGGGVGPVNSMGAAGPRII